MRLFFGLIFLLVLLAPGQVFCEQPETRPAKILILNSFNQGLAWTEKMMEGLRSEFDRALPGFEIYVEYLDTLNYRKDEVFPRLKNFYENRFRDHFDIVVTSDYNAFEFVLKYRDELFRDVPVVFGGVDYPGNIRFFPSYMPKMFGVTMVSDIQANLNLALKIHPGYKKVAVIGDDSTTSPGLMKAFSREAEALGMDGKIIRLVHLSVSELKTALQEIPAGTIVFNLGFYRDRLNVFLSSQKSNDLVMEHCRVPVYSPSGPVLSSGGALGGVIPDANILGVEIAKVAANVFFRSPMLDAGVVNNSYQTVFNYPLLKQYDISMDSLPPLSVVINRPESFWEGNKTVIVGFCLFIIVQSFIIGFLVRNMVRRREAEEALRDSEGRFKSAFQISPDAILIGRLRDGVYTDVNKGFTFLVGYEKEEVIGKSSRDILLWDNSKQERNFYSTVQEKRFVNNFEAKFRLKDGSIITGLISASLFLRHGEPHVLATIRNIESIKKSENKIRQLAYHDLLTGLPNRSLFFDRLEQALRQARREEWKVGLLFFDLDRFKWVNDTLGHAIGDLLLQKVAQRLEKILRKSDTLARLGGDEFVLLLNCVNDVQNVTAVAQKVQMLMSSPFDLEGKRVMTSSSIGIAIFPEDGEDADTLLKNADLAMYSAKEKEGNNFQFFSEELNHKAKIRRDLEQSMSRAMEQKEFFLLYQPQISMVDGSMISFEALLRWRHPSKGIISPENFIPLAEETGLINPLGEWVLRTACAQNRYLQEKGYPSFRVAVNLSGRQFRQPNFINLVDQILADTGLDPSFLELELTESTLMTGVDNTLKTLKELKARGIVLAIDDFGTGYSSLSYLKHFSIDRLKIAQIFVRDIPSDPDNKVIIEAIIGMAHSLRLNVVAEGVETKEQLDFLRQQKCQEMQGYYFAPPMSLEDLASFIRKGYGGRESPSVSGDYGPRGEYH